MMSALRCRFRCTSAMASGSRIFERREGGSCHRTLAGFMIATLAADGVLFSLEWYRALPRGWPVLAALGALFLGLTVLVLCFVLRLLLRRRCQFGIRSLFALVLVVSVPFSWLAAETKREVANAMILKVQAFGGLALDDLDYFSAMTHQRLEPREPNWMRALVGDGFFRHVNAVGFERTPLNDAEFADVSNLAGVERVPTLCLAGTKLTDAGMPLLRRWSGLRTLFLRDTAITDEGLENLTRLHDLSYLSLSNTHVTEKGVGRLQKALPNCHIDR